MKNLMLVASLLFAVSAAAQTPAPTPSAPATSFTIETKALGAFSGNKEVAATDIGAKLKLTPIVSLRSDNLVSADGQNFLNGSEQHFPLEKMLKSTTLDPKQFEFYVVEQAGVARTPKDQQFAVSFGGGLNYSPNADSKFGVNIFEVRWISKFPGPDKIGPATVVSSGINLRF